MVGQVLRKQRESKNLTLQDIASQTHIRSDYLRAIENGQFDKLPSEIYARGYLKHFAVSVGLDVNDILLLYCEEQGNKDETREHDGTNTEKKRSALIYRAFGIVAAVIILVVIAIYFLTHSNNGRAVMQPTVAQATMDPSGLHTISINATETTWIMMVIDNKRVEEYTLRKGDTLTKKGAEGFFLKIGNAGGVSIFLDNRNIGLKGKKKEVVTVAIPRGFELNKRFSRLF